MTQHSFIARRDLLRAGVALFGGSALGILPSLAQADLTKDASRASTGGTEPLSLIFSDGGRFVSADAIDSGDRTLERVRLTITSVGVGIDALEAHAPVPGYGRVPFILWVARPAGLARTRSNVVTEADGGLVLNVYTAGVKREIHLQGGGSSGPKLREGTYILATGKTDLRAFSLNESKRVVSRQPVTPAHVVITVERA